MSSGTIATLAFQFHRAGLCLSRLHGCGATHQSRCSFVRLQEGALHQFAEGLAQLLLRVHYDWAVQRHGLLRAVCQTPAGSECLRLLLAPSTHHRGRTARASGCLLPKEEGRFLAIRQALCALRAVPRRCRISQRLRTRTRRHAASSLRGASCDVPAAGNCNIAVTIVRGWLSESLSTYKTA